MGLRASIETCEVVEVAESYACVDEMLSHVAPVKPELVLLGGNGTAASKCQQCRKIIKAFPGIKVLLLNDEKNDDDLRETILSGAAAFLSIYSDIDEIVRSIDVVAQGGFSFDGETLVRLMARIPQPLSDVEFERLNSLTDRERTVLSYVGCGYRNKVIGQELNVSASTVRNSISQLKFKLYVESRSELIVKGIEYGLVNS